MLTIQEQEERDFNPQPDAVNALAQSRAEKPLNDPLPDDGRFHVYTEYIYFCPTTDATAGTVITVASDHDTYEEAANAANSIGEELEGNDEMWVSIHPRKAVPAPPPVVIPESDMPF